MKRKGGKLFMNLIFNRNNCVKIRINFMEKQNNRKNRKKKHSVLTQSNKSQKGNTGEKLYEKENKSEEKKYVFKPKRILRIY